MRILDDLATLTVSNTLRRMFTRRMFHRRMFCSRLLSRSLFCGRVFCRRVFCGRVFCRRLFCGRSFCRRLFRASLFHKLLLYICKIRLSSLVFMYIHLSLRWTPLRMGSNRGKPSLHARSITVQTEVPTSPRSEIASILHVPSSEGHKGVHCKDWVSPLEPVAGPSYPLPHQTRVMVSFHARPTPSVAFPLCPHDSSSYAHIRGSTWMTQKLSRTFSRNQDKECAEPAVVRHYIWGWWSRNFADSATGLLDG